MKIAREAVVDALHNIGLESDDVVTIHSFLGGFGEFEGGLETITDAARDTVGAYGTIVMPTYTISFLRDKFYDHASSPSEAGALTEFFRQSRYTVRTFDPVYSHCISGFFAAEYSEVYTQDILGRHSLFNRLWEDDALLILFGTSMHRGGTFIHHVERMVGVPYRFMKTFRGQAVRNGFLLDVDVQHYARFMNKPIKLNFNRLEKELVEKGIAKVTHLNRGRILGVRLGDLYREAKNALRKDPYYLVIQ